jgi:NADH-quinone oxidoreductase subunit I
MHNEHVEEHFNNRNVTELDSNYYMVDIADYPVDGWGKFKRVVQRSLRGELFVGLWVVLREMIKFDIHTVQYPAEKMPIGPRYRAVHEMKRLWESDTARPIGCRHCEKI